MHDQRNRLYGLYVITDNDIAVKANQPITVLVEQAIAGGARIIQYRNKSATTSIRQREAGELAQICKASAVTFLVNDDVDTAIAVDADGVHLGQGDMPLSTAREHLGSDKIIGITCHNNFDYALQAQQHGADYVAFGRFFASATKPQAPPADLSILQKAKQQLHIPVCAIGGITSANAIQVIDQGADMLAVIHAVLAADDITQAANEFARLFK
jgi:thiamine-phosphate pyrophosphorylase